jgi:predicted dehydrogenase
MKVAVVGSGAMGRNHIRALLGMNEENQIVVYDPKPTRIDSPRVRYLDSLEEVVACAPDYAVIATPSTSHFEIASFFAEQRLPTLIEKPLALDLSEANKLRDSFESTGTFAAVGHVERFSPAFAVMKQKINEGLVGKVAQISTKRTGPFSRRINDVGVIFDLAAHDVDLVLWLLGGKITEFSLQGRSFLGLANEDTILVHGVLDVGCFFSHEINWLTPKKTREISVLGPRGMLVASSVTQQVTFYEHQDTPHDWESFRELTGDSSGGSVTFGTSVREPLALEHEAFALGIEGTSTDICTIRQGAEVVGYLEEFKKQVDTQ